MTAISIARAGGGQVDIVVNAPGKAKVRGTEERQVVLEKLVQHPAELQRPFGLPTPAGLEGIIRNRQTNDFSSLTQSYYRTFGALPAADQADPLARNMIDIDDGLALSTLKTLKATDQMGELILESGTSGVLAQPGTEWAKRA